MNWTLERIAAASTPDVAGCWIWNGAVNASGYGRYSGWLAHRLAYAAAHGPIPEGLTVDHVCYTLLCVNPDHLRLLTSSENAKLQRSAFKTHCKHGHQFTPENTYIRPTGQRQCRACNRASVHRYSARRSGGAA